MVPHQIIEALEIPFECGHADCEFEAPNGQIASHEKKCDYRKVPCPDGHCSEEVPLRNLLEHMEHEHGEEDELEIFECDDDGVMVETFFLDIGSYNREFEAGREWDRSVCTFQDKHFVMVMTRVERLYYSYLYILADPDEAKNYTVTMTAGHGGQTEKIHRNGQVFPIDDKQKDVLKQRNGVLSFERGTGDLFADHDVPGRQKKVEICFEISRVQG